MGFLDIRSSRVGCNRIVDDQLVSLEARVCKRLLQTAREGNVFISVCQLFCLLGGVYPSMQLGVGCIPACSCVAGCTPEAHIHPHTHRPVAVNAAVDTHPTGMHSC